MQKKKCYRFIRVLSLKYDIHKFLEMEGAQEGVLDLSRRRKNRQRKNNRSIIYLFLFFILKMSIGKYVVYDQKKIVPDNFFIMGTKYYCFFLLFFFIIRFLELHSLPQLFLLLSLKIFMLCNKILFLEFHLFCT